MEIKDLSSFQCDRVTGDSIGINIFKEYDVTTGIPNGKRTVRFLSARVKDGWAKYCPLPKMEEDDNAVIEKELKIFREELQMREKVTWR